jgi:aryl-alcohol dehydrogenase-like predicted oxidoreductase
MDCVLVGARDEKQVKENVGALSFTLSNEDLSRINSAIAEFKLIE